MNTLSLWRSCLAVLLLSIFFSGCGPASVPQESLSLLSWNLGNEPSHLDPGLNSSAEGRDIILNTFEGLVRERGGRVLPGIAERWELSDHGRVLTFFLRESYWSDGTALTAHDFEYAWKRSADPELGSQYSWIWEYSGVEHASSVVKGILPPDSLGVSALDNRTLSVRLGAPSWRFVSMTSLFPFMPVKREAVEAGPHGQWAVDPESAVSNGPFALRTYMPGRGMTLERNPHFWDADGVLLEGITISFTNESSSINETVPAGEYHVSQALGETIGNEGYTELPGLHSFPRLGTYYLSFNMLEDVWRNPLVRRALNLSINRKVLTESLSGHQFPAGAVVPPGFPDHLGRDFHDVAGHQGMAVDDSGFEEARILLAEAGYPGGDGLPAIELMYNNSDHHRQAAELVRDMWQGNLGIEVDLRGLEWAAFEESRKFGNYVLARGGWLSPVLDPGAMLSLFERNNAFNDLNYRNALFDEAIRRARAASNPSGYFEALYEANQILMSDLPIIPIYHFSDVLLIDPRVQGWQRSRLGGTDFRNAVIYAEEESAEQY